MNLRTKNLLYTLVLLVALLVVWLYNKQAPHDLVTIEGLTMGTSYHIKYVDARQRNFKNQIDSLLQAFNMSLNTYWPQSEISQFNQGQGLRFRSPFFYPVLHQSRVIVSGSQGAFDPTVMPLVNAWGFGPNKPLHPDSAQIDSIKHFVGFEKVHFSTDSVWKSDPRVQLDFSAIAKGYGVDRVAEYLRSRAVDSYLVEIGGEVSARGFNPETKQAWKLGILDPNSKPDSMTYALYLTLDNKGLATSGNYFNYRIEHGQKYAHEIDPQTGYPVQRNVLSASVVADNCMAADGWATAFMVMGLDRALDVLDKHPSLGAILIYSSASGNRVYISPGLEPYVERQPGWDHDL